jgi:hypothetical protein
MNKERKSQSSIELLITVSFGLIILLPIVVIALVQVSASSSSLSVSEAQAAASKIAEVSVAVGSQGPPAKELVIIQIPSGVKNILVGNPTGPGHAITFIVNTNAGPSDAVAYTPVNVSTPSAGLPGTLSAAVLEGTYLINVSAQSSCPSNPSIPCVYITTT